MAAADSAATPVEAVVEPEVSPRNKLNELTAKEWLPETVSVWRQKGLGANHPDAQIEKLHPAPFSFTDVSRLIRFFSKSGQLVLDPFVGIGSTLKAAALENRRGVGIELSPVFADLTRQRLMSELQDRLIPYPNQELLEGDCRQVLPQLDTDLADFVVTSPPYWQILHKKDHKVRQERDAKGLASRYSDDDPRDLGNIESYDDFLRELCGIFGECSRVLRRNQYLCAVVGDFRHGGKYHMLHADLANLLEEETAFALKGLTILYQTHKRVFPYGYPAAFVPNLHHQYIVIMRNEK